MARIYFTFTFALTTLLALRAQNVRTTFRSMLTYPGQTLANVWGYTANGKEYALVGASKGMVIVDITNPDAPVQITQVPGPDNLWKEIKTYSHYAYITTEAGFGFQIVDLQNLPSPNLPNYFFQGDSLTPFTLGRLHSLHIDTAKGFLYGYGGEGFGGGAKIFDLKPDPYHPVYAGGFGQLGYIHDGYVDNDTLFSAHIYGGFFAMVDMTDKSVPEILTIQNTPNRFTHNTWLSDDRRTLFTTDEKDDSYLACYDVSDPMDIRFKDKIQSNPGSHSVVHNTYVLNNYAVTSWYKDGFTIVDISKPDNLVQVGNYDTYAGSGGGFVGCWGVYPYFPSGTIIASNIKGAVSGAGELFIITPDYQRACYLEGRVTNAFTGAPINGARIQVLGAQPKVVDFCSPTGNYKVGQANSGTFTVIISKRGFETQQFTVTLSQGATQILNAGLIPVEFTVSGHVYNQTNGMPVAGAGVQLFGAEQYSAAPTDNNGVFLIEGVKPGTYQVVGSHPVTGLAGIADFWISTDTIFNLFLTDKYKKGDSFFLPEAQNAGAQSELCTENPFTGSTQVQYRLSEETGQLTLFDLYGKQQETIQLSDKEGTLEMGAALPPGAYFLRLHEGEKWIRTLQLIKTH